MRAYALPLLLAASVVQAEPATTTRATDLMAQAQSDAAKLVSLPENTKVDIVQRRGAWSEVKAASGQQGWVRMMHLMPDGAAAPARSAAAGKGALAGLLQSGRTANTTTVTTGVRGLQEEDLQQARANPEEFRKMQKHAVAKTAAESFAQRSKLAPVGIDYLEDSAPAAGGTVPGVIGG